ncbi:hypothetical protein JJB99_00975 [Bradyrhizobium diazoefficiens]|uniref:hypothetical protein n=1 Tax=Bradyrhizobium diazoefficiens TaxID=1355477 RepID=UPI00190E3E63|nr:hypothetical protein [Bradyrhizobium diazoefficiens]QQO14802.1 hypothetical protein JJB99_00975 [Bradyrhizobium diazoefficiens]
MIGRAHKAILCFSLAMLTGLWSKQSCAANVYLHKGEGGAGLDAELQLGEADQFNLALIGCRNFARSQRVQLGLYVRADKLPAELERVGNRKDEELTLYLCINETCEERTWKLLESGTGDTYFTTASFLKTRQVIKSIRVILPKEARKYEYRGDIDGILKKICR